MRQLLEFGKGEVAIYAATLGTVVMLDLSAGIVVGIGLALGKLLYSLSHLAVRVQFDPQHGRTVLFLEGTASFGRLPKLAAALETVPRETELHVHFERLDYIDHACLELLMNWEKQQKAGGGSLVVDWDELKAKFRRNGNDRFVQTYRERPLSDTPAGRSICINHKGTAAMMSLQQLPLQQNLWVDSGSGSFPRL